MPFKTWEYARTVAAAKQRADIKRELRKQLGLNPSTRPKGAIGLLSAEALNRKKRR